MSRVLLIAVLAFACTSVVGGESDATGILTGAVSIGPICPVERVGEPCPVPPGLYAGVHVLVRSAATRSLLARVGLDDQGRYRVELPAGAYLVRLEHRLGIDRGQSERTRLVRIEAGATVIEDFEVDTGIR